MEAAQTLATEAQNPELSVEHLMLALIRQTDGIVTPIFQKLGVDIAGVTSAIAAAVEKTPKVQGAAAEMRISHALQSVLDTGFKEATALKDAYVSTEHLLIACAEAKQTEVGKILREAV